MPLEYLNENSKRNNNFGKLYLIKIIISLRKEGQGEIKKVK
jgi:hypothetical protein